MLRFELFTAAIDAGRLPLIFHGDHEVDQDGQITSCQTFCLGFWEAQHPGAVVWAFDIASIIGHAKQPSLRFYGTQICARVR
jgi:hypothetical protein